MYAIAEISIKETNLHWNDEKLGILYSSMANTYFISEEYDLAYSYIFKTIAHDIKYKSSIEYARILVELNRKEEATEVLLSIQDTTKIPWHLSQKAELLIKLEAYNEALEIYDKIDKLDSNYNNNSEIAKTLQAIGKYESARAYLLADTNRQWDSETAKRNLLIHDIKHQNGEKCIESYNAYRDLGMQVDPIGIYRIKIFFLHPFQSIKVRDIMSFIVFLFVLAFIIILPSIWILPVYFIGHHFNYLNKAKSFETLWGLRAFWLVSAGFLIASCSSIFIDPETLHSYFNSSYYADEEVEGQLGLMMLVFISLYSLFAFAALYKRNLTILLSSLWSIRKSIFLGIGILLAYRIVVGIYVRLGISVFDISLDDIANISNILLASRQEITELITNYGIFSGFLIICIWVPIYEEIIFRGVILDACHKYINFNAANFIQSFLFACIHLNLFLFPAFFLFGILTGILRKNLGGLLAGIVFHIVNNSLAIFVYYLRSNF